MTSARILEIAALLLMVTLAGGLLLHGHNARLDRLAARCRAVRERRTYSTRGRRDRRSRPGVLKLVGQFGTQVIGSGLLSEKTLRGLRATLADAGLRPDTALGLFVGAKLLMLLALPSLGWFASAAYGLDGLWRNVLLAMLAAVGLLAPDMTVRQMRARRRQQVERGLPDALDMLIICSEAGMAIGSAITRVAQELHFAHPATADELAATANELQIAGDPQVAFTNMGERTALEPLRRLGVTVVQTIQYGAPLTQALRVLAVELRTEMMTRYEERAARLPVLLTVPMIVFILPALFLVIAGPAAIQVLALPAP